MKQSYMYPPSRGQIASLDCENASRTKQRPSFVEQNTQRPCIVNTVGSCPVYQSESRDMPSVVSTEALLHDQSQTISNDLQNKHFSMAIRNDEILILTKGKFTFRNNSQVDSQTMEYPNFKKAYKFWNSHVEPEIKNKLEIKPRKYVQLKNKVKNEINCLNISENTMKNIVSEDPYPTYTIRSKPLNKKWEMKDLGKVQRHEEMHEEFTQENTVWTPCEVAVEVVVQGDHISIRAPVKTNVKVVPNFFTNSNSPKGSPFLGKQRRENDIESGAFEEVEPAEPISNRTYANTAGNLTSISFTNSILPRDTPIVDKSDASEIPRKQYAKLKKEKLELQQRDEKFLAEESKISKSSRIEIHKFPIKIANLAKNKLNCQKQMLNEENNIDSGVTEEPGISEPVSDRTQVKTAGKLISSQDIVKEPDEFEIPRKQHEELKNEKYEFELKTEMVLAGEIQEVEQVEPVSITTHPKDTVKVISSYSENSISPKDYEKNEFQQTNERISAEEREISKPSESEIYKYPVKMGNIVENNAHSEKKMLNQEISIISGVIQEVELAEPISAKTHAMTNAKNLVAPQDIHIFNELEKIPTRLEKFLDEVHGKPHEELTNEKNEKNLSGEREILKSGENESHEYSNLVERNGEFKKEEEGPGVLKGLEEQSHETPYPQKMDSNLDGNWDNDDYEFLNKLREKHHRGKEMGSLVKNKKNIFRRVFKSQSSKNKN